MQSSSASEPPTKPVRTNPQILQNVAALDSTGDNVTTSRAFNSAASSSKLGNGFYKPAGKLIGGDPLLVKQDTIESQYKMHETTCLTNRQSTIAFDQQASSPASPAATRTNTNGYNSGATTPTRVPPHESKLTPLSQPKDSNTSLRRNLVFNQNQQVDNGNNEDTYDTLKNNNLSQHDLLGDENNIVRLLLI